MDKIDQLIVAIYQMNICWEDPNENIKRIKNEIYNLKKKVDLFVLPEMFTTGFSVKSAHLACTKEDSILKELQEIANFKNSAICGSVLYKENEKIYNRFLFITGNSIEFYDKKYLFSLVGEEKFIARGTKNTIINYKGFKIKPQICYDLRFPENSRIDKENPYDILLYVANWPEKRIKAWENLLIARAIENQTYCIGVNRVGEEPNNIIYNGKSLVVNCFGEIVCCTEDYKEKIEIITLQKSPQDNFRLKFPFFKDQL